MLSSIASSCSCAGSTATTRLQRGKHRRDGRGLHTSQAQARSLLQQASGLAMQKLQCWLE